MGGGGEPVLMEARKRDNVAIGRRWHVLLPRTPPPLGGGLRAENTTADKALQALEGDFRVAPWLHWKMGVGGCEPDDG